MKEYENLTEEQKAMIDRVMAEGNGKQDDEPLTDEARRIALSPTLIEPRPFHHAGEPGQYEKDLARAHLVENPEIEPDPARMALEGPDEWPDALRDQFHADENADAERMLDASLPPEDATAPGSLGRLLRGMVDAPADRPGSWRLFTSHVKEILDNAGAFGADDATLLDHFSRSGVTLIIVLLVLRKVGSLNHPKEIVKGSRLGKLLIPVAKQFGLDGLVAFLTEDNERALATQVRDSLRDFLQENPRFKKLFMQTMTSETDQDVSQSFPGWEWLAESFKALRHMLGRKGNIHDVTGEEG